MRKSQLNREDIMLFKNNVGPQVRKLRNSLEWSQSVLASKLQIAGWDVSRSAVSKIESRLSHVDDRGLMYLAEVLKVDIRELFPKRDTSQSLHAFLQRIQVTRF